MKEIRLIVWLLCVPGLLVLILAAFPQMVIFAMVAPQATQDCVRVAGDNLRDIIKANVRGTSTRSQVAAAAGVQVFMWLFYVALGAICAGAYLWG